MIEEKTDLIELEYKLKGRFWEVEQKVKREGKQEKRLKIQKFSPVFSKLK